MVSEGQHAKAAALRALHGGGIFVLPNAWDAGSAVMIADAGAQAIATTSAGVSWSLGRPDGQNLSREEAVAAVARIAAAVDRPVTADIEGGYGSEPADVAVTVTGVIEAGAVGINLEDSGAPGGGLFAPAAQAARIRAARAAAADAGLPELVINARTDVFLFGIGQPEGRLDDVVARATAYAAAGADSLFVPGLLDLGTLATLTGAVTLPVNVMVGPGAPDVAALAAAGVRRVSLGQAITQAAYTLVRKAAAEALTAGTYDSTAGADSFGDINGAFRPADQDQL
jgi:2-methylisocitrate lyase-like PEP mutase family enzyme